MADDPRTSQQQQADETKMIRALVLPYHERLYRESADFKAGINVIARALPIFVQFMAEQEVLRQMRMEAMIREANLHPGPGFRVDGVQTGRFPRDADLGPRSEDNRG